MAINEHHQHHGWREGREALFVVESDINQRCADSLWCAWESHPYFWFDPSSNYCGSFLSISRNSEIAERESHLTINKHHQPHRRGEGRQALFVVESDINRRCADSLWCAWESHPHFWFDPSSNYCGSFLSPSQGIRKQRRERVTFGNKRTPTASRSGGGAPGIVGC